MKIILFASKTTIQNTKKSDPMGSDFSFRSGTCLEITSSYRSVLRNGS